MTITAAQVKELRDRTGIAMMKCKKALTEANGDMEVAVEALRKAGLATADKKSDRETNAGGIGLAVGDDAAVLVLLACETDFVSGNDQFKQFVQGLADFALANGIADKAGLEAATIDGASFKDYLAAFVAKVGENLVLSDVKKVAGGAVAGYNHGGRVAAVVAGNGDAAVLRNVAMHIAASNPAPIAIDRDGVPAELLDKEREIIAASDEIQSKPEAIRPKIVEGKLGRFYKERVLLEQDMLVDNEDGANVADWAKGKSLEIAGFELIAV